jgi:hypothetical protein
MSAASNAPESIALNNDTAASAASTVGGETPALLTALLTHLLTEYYLKSNETPWNLVKQK